MYTQKKDLVTDFAKFKNVDNDYFDNMFLIGLLFYLVLVILFLLDRLLGRFKRSIANSIRRTSRKLTGGMETRLFDYVNRLSFARRREVHRIVMRHPFYLMAFCFDSTFDYRNNSGYSV